jgi:hypothetical protein
MRRPRARLCHCGDRAIIASEIAHAQFTVFILHEYSGHRAVREHLRRVNKGAGQQGSSS